ncbi:MAG: formylglycine-generating enzyme family protein [Gallionellaceae bacterium]
MRFEKSTLIGGLVLALLAVSPRVNAAEQSSSSAAHSEQEAEQKQRLQRAIAAIKVKDAATARAALPQIRQLKAQAPGSRTLLRLEAKACHLVQDFACAEAAYAAWLKTAPRTDPRRKQMVAALMQARQHEALSVVPATLGAMGEVIHDCSDCPEMAVIPARSFEMGEANAKHTVTFHNQFAIGKTEVTQGQWQAIMGNNPSNFGSCGDNCPVENVSWDDAQEFIRKLNTRTGKRYRLPSEAEWEAACRGGEEQQYCGSDNVGRVAWYTRNSGSATHSVAEKRANTFGLYDMSGNVWEWVQDSWHADYNGAPTDGSAWQGDRAKRVLRGGSWFDLAQNVRAASRSGDRPARRIFDYGFRLARTLP